MTPKRRAQPRARAKVEEPRPPHPADEPGPMAFVDDLDRPMLEPADRHHLERVLRMRTGDPLTVADGAGRWRPAVFGASITPTAAVAELPVAEPAVTVCFALLKGERLDLVVQKLTELGVDRIVPFAAKRSVVRWDPLRAARNVERLRAIARAAAAQAHRPRLPEVAEVASFDEVAELPGAARCERLGRPPTTKLPVLLVGPEGGWSEEEREAPIPTVALAGHVLRAETAAVVAGGFLTALRAGTVRASGARRHAG